MDYMSAARQVHKLVKVSILMYARTQSGAPKGCYQITGFLLIFLLLAGCTFDDLPLSKLPAAPVIETANAANTHNEKTEGDELALDSIKLISEDRLAEASEKINKALSVHINKSYYHLINGLAYHIMAHKGLRNSTELAEQGYKLSIQYDNANWLAHYFLGG